MKLTSLIWKTAVTLVAAVFLLVAWIAGPPFVQAWSAVHDAEAQGKLDHRTWQEALPPNIGHALIATMAPTAYSKTPIANSLGGILSRRHEGTMLRWHLRRFIAGHLLSARYSEDQLADDYARLAYFGRGAYGIDAGARAWFGKSASELSIGESAFLVGVLRSPNNRYDPALAVERRNLVLARMRDRGSISDVDFEHERAAPLVLIAPH